MITLTNNNTFVQKVQYQIKGKVYTQAIDGQDTPNNPFEETMLQPGESLTIDPVDGWFKVRDMLGGAQEPESIG